jgi:hypothetical protein
MLSIIALDILRVGKDFNSGVGFLAGSPSDGEGGSSGGPFTE